METLLKGLYGEMLIKSNIIPLEKTKNNFGLFGNEPFKGYISHKSLCRCMSESPNKYFKQKSNEIIKQLEIYYKELWKTNEKEYLSIIDYENTGGVFNNGDIITIPIDIKMRYNFTGNWGNINKEHLLRHRYIEGIWTFNLNFNIKD